MTRKNKKRKEEICEDYCFACKDGGVLIICDYKDCLKAYHPECVGKDESFVEADERWSCMWHYCFLCQKRAKFSCFGCPRGVCGRCIYDAEFVLIRGDKGFCEQCLNLAFFIENGQPADSETAIIDFKDENTYEFFFKGYWEHIKIKEGLTRECVCHADKLLKNGKNYRCDSFFHETGKIDENIGESEEESNCVVSDYDDLKEVDKLKVRRKRSKSNKKMRGTNRKEKSKKKEFVGWGSKSLLDFLASVNKDTSEPLAEYEVVSIVMDYCKENKLFDPEKKKRIVCDEMLRALFGRKFLLKNSLSKLLAAHYAANVDDSVGDRLWSSSSDDADVNYTRKKLPDSTRKTQKSKECFDVQKSCFAMVNTENIKLVYLNRSLVEELSKQLESFCEKVVGSFVRVKCNPNDYLQKNSHQLLQVKGVTSSDGHILLQFFNCPEDFPLHKLSDDNFTEEECEDLRNKIKDGLLKKPTVVELEQKARILHEDIIKHWIPKELALLQKRIDQANEKGWRREMCEYMNKVQVLNNPSERSRLINELPEIIAEIAGPELGGQGFEGDDRDRRFDSPDTPVMGASPQYPYLDWGSGIFSDQSDDIDQEIQSERSVYEKLPQQSHTVASEVGHILERESRESVLETNGICCKELFPNDLQEKQPPNVQEVTIIENQSNSKVEVLQLSDDEPEYYVGTTHQPLPDFDTQKTRDQTNQCKGSANAELANSSNGTRECRVEIGDQPLEDLNAPIWYCVTGLGHRNGPFQMSVLKKYHDARQSRREKQEDVNVEMKVWKIGERQDDAILLEDAIRKLFS